MPETMQRRKMIFRAGAKCVKILRIVRQLHASAEKLFKK
jgi:hypothetical protein